MSESKGNKKSFPIITLLSIAVLTSAYFANKYYKDRLRERLDGTLESLLTVERSVHINPNARVAIGYGSCLDIVAPASHLITLHHSPPLDPSHHGIINTQQELLESFAFYYKFGAAAEYVLFTLLLFIISNICFHFSYRRFVANKTIFEGLVQSAASSPQYRESIGGNAPVMASRFVKEGLRHILLGSHDSEYMSRYLPEGITVSGTGKNAGDQGSSPRDVHLLIEYAAGETWGSLVAPRANRFIVHSDSSNPFISSLEQFHSMLPNFRPDLVIVSGLQMLDNFPFKDNEGIQRIDQLAKQLQVLKEALPSAMIHFEMASFTQENLFKELVKSVIPQADSLGMNEQELPNLVQMLEYGNITLVAPSYPRTAVVLDQMRKVFSLVKGKRLSRIHVHTLAFQAVLVKKHSYWQHARVSAAKSALTAHRHTCGSHSIDVEKAKLIMDDSFTTSDGFSRIRIQFDPKIPVPCWEESISNSSVEICIAPVLVCTEVLQTGGGGDNVSAAGLVVHL